MALQIQFLGWDRPLLELAVEKLASDWQDGIPDMSGILIVTQTRQSGRRLREALAKHAASLGKGIFPPQTVTPDFFLKNFNPSMKVACDLEMHAAWIDVIRNAGREKLDALKLSKRDDFSWVHGLAVKICELRNLLAENGYMIADVARIGFDAGIQEPERWEALAALESSYRVKLRKSGLEDANFAKIKSEGLIPEIKKTGKIILIGVCDPIPLAMRKIEKISDTKTVEAWVHAPGEISEKFDASGCPVPEKWENVLVDFHGHEEGIRLTGGPEAQADEILKIIRERKKINSVKDIAVSVLNENILPAVEKAFSDAGIKTFNPAGETLSVTQVFHLIKTFADFAENEDYSSFASFVRNPDFLSFLESENRDFESVKFLQELDEFQNSRLPGKLESSRMKKEEVLGTVYDVVTDLLHKFREQQFAGFIRNFLSEIYKDREVRIPDGSGQRFLSSIELVGKMIAEAEDSAVESFRLSASDKLKLFVALMKDGKIYPQHPADVLPLQGWLELPWEGADTLVLAGMNEGYLPDSLVGDIFLPDLPREKLGLMSNRRRFARDTYLMNSIIESRRSGGVCCIAGKTDVSGEPLKPSRLFFLCPSDILVERADKLFGAPVDKKLKPLSRTLSWKLRTPQAEVPVKLSVTDFKSYLACPYRFYLRKILMMEAVDDRKSEMDQLDFGVMCHRTLENFFKNEDVRKSRSSDGIRGFLDSELENVVKMQFGNSLPLPILIQLESAKRRFAKFAEIQAVENAEGWELAEVEHKIGGLLGGMTIRGKIDRIEINRSGTVRILDYKTSDKAEPPKTAHLRSERASGANGYSIFEKAGSKLKWADLQLPLYYMFLKKEEEFAGRKIICGYFNLPKAVSETGIQIWEDMDEFITEAERCASGVVECIRDGIFWPPADKIRNDDFEELFYGTALDSVEEFSLKKQE